MVEQTFAQMIHSLPSENHYSAFCRSMLEELNECEAWRYEELPLLLRQKLALENLLAEGVIFEADDKFSLWLSFRLPAEETYLSRKILTHVLKDFIALRKKDSRLNRLIILSTVNDVDEILTRNRSIKIYTIAEQERYVHILQKLQKSSVSRFDLYSYQKRDLQRVMERINKRGSRQLFDAYCGYGKTNIFIEMTLQYHTKHPNDLVILTFPLLTIQNQTVNRFYKHIVGMENYDPLTLCFSSSSSNGIVNSTDYDILRKFMSEKGPKIIFTTYTSFDRLIEYLENDKIPLVVLDEVHNFNSWSLFYSMTTTNFIGFTATPLKSVENNFKTVVRRDLIWSVENQRSCDFELVCYGASGKSTSVDGQMIMDLFNQRLVTKLLVIAQYEKDLVELQKIINNYDICCHIVVANDSQNERRRKEKEIEEAERGVLLSVRIYREGIDFPWMDGIFLCCERLQQYQTVQSFLRVTRPSIMKKNARIFLPFIINKHKKFYQHNIFEMVPSFASFLTKHLAGENREERNQWFLQRLHCIKIDQIENTLIIASDEEVLEAEEHFKMYCNYYKNMYADLKVRINSWKHLVDHAILILFDSGVFSVEALLKHVDTLAKYKGSQGKDPCLMMKKALHDLCVKHNIGVVDFKAGYCFYDRASLIEIAQNIPAEFPIEN